MKVKVCGIRNWEDASTAIEAGADAIGFLVGITHLAEDKIGDYSAKAIIQKMPPFVSSVLVTHLTNPDKILKLADFLNVTTIQIHDYIPPEQVLYIKQSLPKCKIIKAVHVSSEADTMELMQLFQKSCDALLLDSRTKDRLGGTGLTHDWNISQKVVESSALPVILAGGLTDENVYQAVEKTCPYGVDANSGIETGSWKDAEKVRRFVLNAHKAEADLKNKDAYKWM